jgi:hypothetical protein
MIGGSLRRSSVSQAEAVFRVEWFATASRREAVDRLKAVILELYPLVPIEAEYMARNVVWELEGGK